MARNNTLALASIPVSDGNFILALREYASNEEIQEAISIMQGRDGKDKARIGACERELRRRAKVARTQTSIK